MAEYIDRQAVMTELEKEVELADDWNTAHEIANVVKYFPVADVQEVKQEIKANETEGVSIKIYANASQMRQICDFMKVIGVNYEM